MSDSTPELRDQPGAWPVSSSEVLYDSNWVLTVRADEVSRPGHDESFRRFVVDLPGAVMILAIDDDDRVVVLWQYRHPAGGRLVELPAGLLDVPGEDPIHAAQRELREEAGLEADHWQHLITVAPSPGISTERHLIYLATGLRESGRGDFTLEHEEADMAIGRVPVADLVDAVLRGDVHDAPLVSGVLAYDVLRRRGGVASSVARTE